MLLNSIEFFIFFAIFFPIYWLLFKQKVKAQNLIILVGSYSFYAFWDWRFLLLLFGSTLINYFLGIFIYQAQKEKFKKLLTYLAIAQNIGILLFFKYFNFFIDSLIDLFAAFNVITNLNTIYIILPIGISFYTFRILSYILDIDKGKISPIFDWIVFFSYVSFFPTVLSGPIDRASTFIPQLDKPRKFNYSQAIDGLRQILWGLFKKIVIADQLAVASNYIFHNYDTLPASSLLLGAFYFTIQLYADFSGYSDMAIGFANLLGLKVTKNFDFPFFAQNIAEFWRKWHISLTSWLTDYVYTPLSIKFRDLNKLGTILSIVITFTLIGMWHGANWTFVVFGIIHGLYYIPLIVSGKFNKRKKQKQKALFPSLRELKNMLGTFLLVMLANIIFKADNIAHAFSYFKSLFSISIFSPPKKDSVEDGIAILLSLILLLIGWLQRDKEHALQIESIKLPKILRYSLYICLIYFIFYTKVVEQNFIYFQF